MQWHRLGPQAPRRRGAKEIGFRFDRRRGGPQRQVEPGHLPAQLVGEGHIGAAMHNAMRVALPLVGIDLADELVLVAGDDPDAEMQRHAGERPSLRHVVPYRSIFAATAVASKVPASGIAAFAGGAEAGAVNCPTIFSAISS